MLQHPIVCGVCEQLITHNAILIVVVRDVYQPCSHTLCIVWVGYPDYSY